MKRRFGQDLAVLGLFAIAAGGIASAQNGVYIGTDYFTTGTGTEVQFPFVKTKTKLKGKPLSGFRTVDTEVAREGIALFDTAGRPATTTQLMATIPIQITALSLTGNLKVGNVDCTVDITLDPANLANDVGSMTLFESSPPPNPAGGLFNSTLNVYYEATFTPANCPVPKNPIFGSYTMVQQGGTWSSVAPAGAYLTVKEPANCTPTVPPTAGACLGTPAQTANRHSGLAAGVTDFYLTGAGIENGPTAAHVVCGALKTAGGGQKCASPTADSPDNEK